MRLVSLAVVFLALLAIAPRAEAAPWRAPVPGRVLTAFTFDRAAAFAAGQHRGVDLAASAGTRVRAACGGAVRFAGLLPGGRRGVSVVCGGLVATHLDLAAVRVRRGATVRRGAVVGVAAGPSVHLGARRLGVRHGYLDPLSLIGRDEPPSLGPAPAPRLRRPIPRVAPVPSPTPVRQPRPAGVPAAAWAGLVLLAAGVPLGGLVRRSRRRRVLPRAPVTVRR